jgi:cyclopropane-fatty-acyl-phospholipid synthase
MPSRDTPLRLLHAPMNHAPTSNARASHAPTSHHTPTPHHTPPALRAVPPPPPRAVPALEPSKPHQPSPLRHRLLDLALERQAVPDLALRGGARYGAWSRERRESRGGVVVQEERLRALLRRMSSGPIAEVPHKTTEQHHNLPPEFLGPRRKYSTCLWEPRTRTLAQAEDAMLALSCRRAQVRDGMRILDLGCGWGSLSLWLAEQYPRARVTGVSSSSRQRTWIESERDRRGLRNLDVITADVSDFAPVGRFDRVISIEMFEHIRNWRELLRRVSTWLADDGKAFLDVFSHRTFPYLVDGTWAAERFLTAGLMPGHDLLPRFQEHLELADRWVESGTHYAKTLHAWRARLDAHADEALEVLIADGLSPGQARAVLGGWRLFLLSSEELASYRGGNRWLTSHYLLAPRSA